MISESGSLNEDASSVTAWPGAAVAGVAVSEPLGSAFGTAPNTSSRDALM